MSSHHYRPPYTHIAGTFSEPCGPKKVPNAVSDVALKSQTSTLTEIEDLKVPVGEECGVPRVLPIRLTSTGTPVHRWTKPVNISLPDWLMRPVWLNWKIGTP